MLFSHYETKQFNKKSYYPITKVVQLLSVFFWPDFLRVFIQKEEQKELSKRAFL